MHTYERTFHTYHLFHIIKRKCKHLSRYVCCIYFSVSLLSLVAPFIEWTADKREKIDGEIKRDNKEYTHNKRIVPAFQTMYKWSTESPWKSQCFAKDCTEVGIQSPCVNMCMCLCLSIVSMVSVDMLFQENHKKKVKKLFGKDRY